MITKQQMIVNSTALKLNFLLSQWRDFNILTNSYINVSYTFTIIGFITDSTLKFINDTISRFFLECDLQNEKPLLICFYS